MRPAQETYAGACCIPRPSRRGFSLVEVIVAVAVFSGAIVAILGLLGPTLKTTREVLDTATAARLADSIDAELDRLVDVIGFAAVRGNTADGNQIEFFGLADGSHIVVAGSANNNPVTDNPRGIDWADRYFRIVIRQLDAPVSDDQFLALSIRAEWPFATQQLNEEAAPTGRKWFSFNTGLRR